MSGKANVLARIRFPPGIAALFGGGSIAVRSPAVIWPEATCARFSSSSPRGNHAVSPGLPGCVTTMSPRNASRSTNHRLTATDRRSVSAHRGHYDRRPRIRQRRIRIRRASEFPAGNAPEPAIQRASRSNGREAWRPPVGRFRFRPSPSPKKTSPESDPREKPASFQPRGATSPVRAMRPHGRSLTPSAEGSGPPARPHSLIVRGQPGNCAAPGWVTSAKRGQHSKVTSRVDFLNRISPQPSAQPGLPR